MNLDSESESELGKKNVMLGTQGWEKGRDEGYLLSLGLMLKSDSLAVWDPFRLSSLALSLF